MCTKGELLPHLEKLGQAHNEDHKLAVLDWGLQGDIIKCSPNSEKGMGIKIQAPWEYKKDEGQLEIQVEKNWDWTKKRYETLILIKQAEIVLAGMSYTQAINDKSGLNLGLLSQAQPANTHLLDHHRHGVWTVASRNRNKRKGEKNVADSRTLINFVTDQTFDGYMISEIEVRHIRIAVVFTASANLSLVLTCHHKTKVVLDPPPPLVRSYTIKGAEKFKGFLVSWAEIETALGFLLVAINVVEGVEKLKEVIVVPKQVRNFPNESGRDASCSLTPFYISANHLILEFIVDTSGDTTSFAIGESFLRHQFPLVTVKEKIQIMVANDKGSNISKLKLPNFSMEHQTILHGKKFCYAEKEEEFQIAKPGADGVPCYNVLPLFLKVGITNRKNDETMNLAELVECFDYLVLKDSHRSTFYLSHRTLDSSYNGGIETNCPYDMYMTLNEAFTINCSKDLKLQGINGPSASLSRRCGAGPSGTHDLIAIGMVQQVSFFLIWDPGGIQILNHHLEDKVVVQAGSIDRNLAIKGQNRNFKEKVVVEYELQIP